MRKSIYLKLIFIFIGVFLFGNVVAFSIVSLFAQNTVLEDTQNQILKLVSDAKQLYEEGRVDAADIEMLHRNSLIRIAFYTDADAVMKDYNVEAEELQTVAETPVLFVKKNHIGMVCAVKSGGYYIMASPNINLAIKDVRTIMLYVVILSISIGSLVMLLAAWFIIRPVKTLSKATQKIAEGDFSVHIREKGKDEIGRLIVNFNTMAKELQGMEMMRSNFISDISHEFKTPLTAIEGYTKLLRSCGEEERNEYIDIIVEETKRLSALSSNILLLNKLENLNISIPKAPFLLDEQIRKILLFLEPEWSKKNIELQLDMEQARYTGNEQLLYQVWLNLIDNAVKFSNKNSTLEISLKEKNTRLYVTVTDYGKGMTEEEQKRMFEKFYTGDASRGTEGNGLGLAIVKKIIEMHGGSIEVQSKQGEFTAITVVL